MFLFFNAGRIYLIIHPAVNGLINVQCTCTAFYKFMAQVKCSLPVLASRVTVFLLNHAVSYAFFSIPACPKKTFSKEKREKKKGQEEWLVRSEECISPAGWRRGSGAIMRS
jgi:hypothetical protein